MDIAPDLVVASRTLAHHGVIDAYGHASARSPANPGRYFMARSLAPELVTEADIVELDLDGNPVGGGDVPLYRERYIHGEIYKARADVKAIVHHHSPTVVPFACTGHALRPIFHMAAFVGLGVPTWDIRDAQLGSDMLVKTPFLGEHLARRLGPHPAVLMRGHGATVVGESLPVAVGRSIYLERNARMQLEATLLAGAGGKIVFMDEAEVAANVAWQDYERPWNLWKTKALAKLDAERRE
jgi:HCOMODA/2-hydroxy-3-carboxy-muconic semialdehyde decarboxylase